MLDSWYLVTVNQSDPNPPAAFLPGTLVFHAATNTVGEVVVPKEPGNGGVIRTRIRLHTSIQVYYPTDHLTQATPEQIDEYWKGGHF